MSVAMSRAAVTVVIRAKQDERNACSAGLGSSRIQAASYNSLKKRKSSDNFDLKKILPYMANLSLGLKESGRVWGR